MIYNAPRWYIIIWYIWLYMIYNAPSNEINSNKLLYFTWNAVLAENIKNKTTISHLFGDGLISSFWIEYVCAELQEFRRFSPVLESILSEVGSLYSSNIEIIRFFSIFSQFWETFVHKFTNKSSERKLISLIYLNNLCYSCSISPSKVTTPHDPSSENDSMISVIFGLFLYRPFWEPRIFLTRRFS